MLQQLPRTPRALAAAPVELAASAAAAVATAALALTATVRRASAGATVHQRLAGAARCHSHRAAPASCPPKATRRCVAQRRAASGPGCAASACVGVSDRGSHALVAGPLAGRRARLPQHRRLGCAPRRHRSSAQQHGGGGRRVVRRRSSRCGCHGCRLRGELPGALAPPCSLARAAHTRSVLVFTSRRASDLRAAAFRPFRPGLAQPAADAGGHCGASAGGLSAVRSRAALRHGRVAGALGAAACRAALRCGAATCRQGAGGLVACRVRRRRGCCCAAAGAGRCGGGSRAAARRAAARGGGSASRRGCSGGAGRLPGSRAAGLRGAGRAAFGAWQSPDPDEPCTLALPSTRVCCGDTCGVQAPPACNRAAMARAAVRLLGAQQPRSSAAHARRLVNRHATTCGAQRLFPPSRTRASRSPPARRHAVREIISAMVDSGLAPESGLPPSPPQRCSRR